MRLPKPKNSVQKNPWQQFCRVAGRSRAGLGFARVDGDGFRPLAVRPMDAAVMLGISVSSLERLTKAGEIPRLKDGNKVLYRVAALEAWLVRREAKDGIGQPKSK
jgi:excisionase family DNA binding protein